jgi:translation initiation factor IF-2
VTRNCNLRVVRNSEVVYTGKLDSLKRMKEDAKDVATGFECGIGIDNFSDWKEGDIIDAFKMVTKRRTLAMT